MRLMSGICIYCNECRLKCTLITESPYFIFEELPLKGECSGNNGGTPATPNWKVGELDVNIKIRHIRRVEV